MFGQTKQGRALHAPQQVVAGGRGGCGGTMVSFVQGLRKNDVMNVMYFVIIS